MANRESERVFEIQLGTPSELVRATITTKDPVRAAKIAQSITNENKRKLKAKLN